MIDYTDKILNEMNKHNFKNYLKKDTVYDHPRYFIQYAKTEETFKKWLVKYINDMIINPFYQSKNTITGDIDLDIELISKHIFDPILLHFDKLYHNAMTKTYAYKMFINHLEDEVSCFMKLEDLILNLYEGQIYCKIAESKDMLKPITRLNWR